MRALIAGLAILAVIALSWLALFAVGFLMPAWIPFTIAGLAGAYLWGRDGGEWTFLITLALLGTAALSYAHGW